MSIYSKEKDGNDILVVHHSGGIDIFKLLDYRMSVNQKTGSLGIYNTYDWNEALKEPYGSGPVPRAVYGAGHWTKTERLAHPDVKRGWRLRPHDWPKRLRKAVFYHGHSNGTVTSVNDKFEYRMLT